MRVSRTSKGSAFSGRSGKVSRGTARGGSGRFSDEVYRAVKSQMVREVAPIIEEMEEVESQIEQNPFNDDLIQNYKQLLKELVEKVVENMKVVVSLSPVSKTKLKELRFVEVVDDKLQELLEASIKKNAEKVKSVLGEIKGLIVDILG